MAALRYGIEGFNRNAKVAAAARDTGPLESTSYALSCSPAPPTVSEPELRVVLLGGNWSQRNLVSNLILGGKHFTRQPNSFIKITVSVKNRKISVINTPDLEFPSPDSLTEFITDCAAASDPGPHVFLLVLQPENFTKEEKHRIHQVLYHFSDQSFDHSLIMILNPKQEGSGLKEKYMKNPLLKELIRDCSYRYLFQMMVEPQELLIHFDQILKENKGEHVSYKEPEETASPGWLLAAGKNEDRLRMVLIGKTGSGKSSSGNTILGRKVFRAEASPRSITRTCQKADSEVDGRHVVVVDTPGLFDTNLTPDQVNEELKSCISLVAPGPHVFLLVLQIGRFTKEDRKTLRLIEEVLGQNYKKFTVVLFTGGDTLEYEEMSIKHYTNHECDEACKDLIRACRGRIHVFNNNKQNNRSQVTELIEMIDIIVKENEGSCYTREMLCGVNI